MHYNNVIITSLWWKRDVTMNDNTLRYTLRVDRGIFQKFKYIAESEGRSANRSLEQYIKKRVAKYEEDNGIIEIEED